MTSKVTKDLNKFSKEQLLSAKRYINSKDILNVILENGKTYSFDEVDGLLTKALERKVN